MDFVHTLHRVIDQEPGEFGSSERWSDKKSVRAAVFRFPALSIVCGLPPRVACRWMVSFKVAAVLIGNGRASDLVLVEDTVISTVRDIQARIETIGRAMDSLESKKPITAILIGPRPSAIELDAMTRVSRILPVGSSEAPNQTAALRNWLAVLMSLKHPICSSRLRDLSSSLSIILAPNAIRFDP